MAETEKGVTVVSDDQEWWIGMDGDDMGKEVENSLLDNDIAKSQTFDKQIKAAFAEIEEYITEHEGKVIFNGGDNILFTINGDPKEIGDDVRRIYKEHTNHTATVGCGQLPLEAHKALVIGKNTGKNQVVVWDAEQEKVYEEIKEQQKTLETCEDEVREEGDYETGATPALKYRAQTHFARLISLGYDESAASRFVHELYGASYRDLLQQRKKRPLVGTSSAEVYLRSGEQAWSRFLTKCATQEQPMKDVPNLHQKFLGKNGVGIVRFVGRRFVSVEWVDGKKERIALKTFQASMDTEDVRLIPQIRVARKVS